MNAIRTLSIAVLATALGFGTAASAFAQPEAPVALPAQDSTYLMASHQSHMSEMISGTQAAAMGTCPQVRELGVMLVADHTRLDAMGAAVALPNMVPLPLTPNSEQVQQIRDTGMQRGRDFDIAWLRMQERFHIQSLQAGSRQQQFGTAAQVTSLASTAAPTVEHHLMLVREALTLC